MREREIRILAVNPGSRYLGIAVFHSTELVDWGVRSMRENLSSRKSGRIKSILTEIAETQGINCLAIKRLHPARSSKYLKELAHLLRRWAIGKRLVVREYDVKEIEGFLLPSEKGNKRRLMEEIAVRYPFLYQELERERQNRNPYLVRMFEAVALGVNCLSGIERSKGRKSISNICEKE